MKRTTLIINSRFLTQPTSGVQRFAIEISKQIKQLFPEALFVSPKNVFNKELEAALNVKTFGKYSGHLWEQYELPLYLKKNGSPLLLNLTNTAPVFYKRNIVTIHDLAVYDFPSSYSKSFKIFYKALLPRISKKALKVLTVSNFSKKRIYEEFGQDSEVIYNAVSGIFYFNKDVKKEKFILAVSSIDPKKNFDFLISAFLKADLKGYKLVVVGARNNLFKTSLNVDYTDKRIEFTGYISDKELVNLYQKASFFVYPSLYEGFGIPPLEAMQSGCPTIVSNIQSIKEVCGTATEYIDPLNIASLVDKLKEVTGNPGLQQSLIAKGIDRAKSYSWESSAKKVANAITPFIQ